MRVMLTINGVDFTPWVEEDGITQDYVERQTRSVVTLDGTEHRKCIKKRSMNVTLLDLPDYALSAAEQALTTTPGSVDYTDKRLGNRYGILFHISGESAGAKKVIGDTTYWSGISFTLEEK